MRTDSLLDVKITSLFLQGARALAEAITPPPRPPLEPDGLASVSACWNACETRSETFHYNEFILGMPDKFPLLRIAAPVRGPRRTPFFEEATVLLFGR